MSDHSENTEDVESEKELDVVGEELDDDLAELDEDEIEDVDEVETQAAEKKQEVGAVRVIGQGDFGMGQSNRGADDPGDNTLCEPQYICKYGDMLFISDRGNHRALIWNQMPQEDGEPASLVLGQEDFADCLENRGVTTTLDEMTSGMGSESLDPFTISKAQDDTMSQPAGIAVIAGQLYVVDSGNHRVLRWDTLPTDDGEVPHLVMGQDNLEYNEANRRGVISSGSLFFPMAIRSGDDKHVMIADKDNHRVLIWNKPPFRNGWNADLTLGQIEMDGREPNRGEFDKCGPDTMSFPTGVFYHAETDKLIVVDQGNNRVLIWNKLPTQNGRAADIVLGQKNMYTRSVNAGYGARRSSADGLYFPTDVMYGRKGLFISDTGNNRVLVWKTMPTENGQPADLVIGQKSFSENKFNRNGEVSAHTLNDPYGLFLDEDPENEEDPGRLYIADRGNARVVVWEKLPEQEKPKDETLEQEEEEVESDELMGDDDDFIKEKSPEKVPSV